MKSRNKLLRTCSKAHRTVLGGYRYSSWYAIAKCYRLCTSNCHRDSEGSGLEGANVHADRVHLFHSSSTSSPPQNKTMGWQAKRIQLQPTALLHTLVRPVVYELMLSSQLHRRVVWNSPN